MLNVQIAMDAVHVLGTYDAAPCRDRGCWRGCAQYGRRRRRLTAGASRVGAGTVYLGQRPNKPRLRGQRAAQPIRMLEHVHDGTRTRRDACNRVNKHDKMVGRLVTGGTAKVNADNGALEEG